MNNKDKNIQQELKELSPLLADIPKPEIKDVPAGYFDTIEDQLIGLTNISSVHDHKDTSGIPEGYFESLENKIIQRLQSQPVEVRSNQLKIIRKVMKIAAAFVFVLTSYLTIRQYNPYGFLSTPDEIALQDDDAMWDYLIDNSDDITLNMLIDNGLVEVSDLDVQIANHNK